MTVTYYTIEDVSGFQTEQEAYLNALVDYIESNREYNRIAQNINLSEVEKVEANQATTALKIAMLQAASTLVDKIAELNVFTLENFYFVVLPDEFNLMSNVALVYA